MCGIAGIVVYRGGESVDRDELLRMRDAMSHRGPDGSGLQLVEPGVGLAHRRLAIIDLSDRGAQPMASVDGNLVVTFNGEIYNYRALRKELEAAGRIFRTESDTEVLLHLYAERGEAMLHALRGMYAFAIWDRSTKRLFLARDPYGIKPLYYADDGRALRFASEVKALHAGGAVGRVIEPAGLVGYLCFGSVPEPWTCFREIRSLSAGHFMVVSEEGSRLRAFASVTEALSVAGDPPTDVCTALRDSVAHHLVADVPVGAFLSAGVDSGALVALMKEAQHEVRTITIAFEEFVGTPNDEAPLAEAIARRYDTKHSTVVVTRDDFASWLPRMVEAMDQPSVDGLNTWIVSRAAADAGLKVAVSGLGGDELLGGYSTFREVPLLARALWLPAKIPSLGEWVRRGVVAFDPVRWRLSPKTAGLLLYGGSYPGAYFLRRGLFMPWELEGLLPREVVVEGLERLNPTEHVRRTLEPDPKNAFRRVAILEATHYLRNQLLRDTDWASMAHSLEVRVPLVDFTLLRELAPVLPRLGSNGKQTLGSCPRPPLPAEVLERRKTGFGLPLSEWLAQPNLGLDTWRRVPALAADGCHWSRRLAYALAHRVMSAAL